MLHISLFIGVILVAGLYVSWNIGANDVANVVGTGVGSKAMTLTQALILAAIFEFLGACLLGKNVANTMEVGLVDITILPNALLDYIYGMASALLACGVWLQMASFFGLPVSTSHTVIGAIFGFGIVAGGVKAIFWKKMFVILLGWLSSPLLGAIIGYLIFRLIKKQVLNKQNPVPAAKKMAYMFVGITCFFFAFVTIYGANNFIGQSMLFSVASSLIFSSVVTLFISFFVNHIFSKNKEYIRSNRRQEFEECLRKATKHLARAKDITSGSLQGTISTSYQSLKILLNSNVSNKLDFTRTDITKEFEIVEKIFSYLQIVVICSMAFAHGSNDVANATGPVSAILKALRTANYADVNISPFKLLLMGGFGIIVGLATWGWRVVETIGKKITELTPTRGFAAGWGTSIVVIVASKIGIPVSTTQVLVGAVVGVGMCRGFAALNINVVRDIVVSWIVTIPIGAILSAIFFYIFKAIF